MSFISRWKERLPKEKTQEELDAHFDRMDEMELEKVDFLAMILGAWMAFWPILVMVAVIILIPMLFFRVF